MSVLKTTLKPTAISIDVCLELKNYIKEVWLEHASTHGGKLHVTFEKGEQYVMVYRLYSECKATFMRFPRKVRVSTKSKLFPNT